MHTCTVSQIAVFFLCVKVGGVMTRLRNRRSTVRISRKKEFFSSPDRPDRLWGPHAAPYSVGTGVVCRRYSGRGRGPEVDYCLLSSAKIKN
jgi:hypothetical protein